MRNPTLFNDRIQKCDYILVYDWHVETVHPVVENLQDCQLDKVNLHHERSLQCRPERNLRVHKSFANSLIEYRFEYRPVLGLGSV
jgi:hypothetical protein